MKTMISTLLTIFFVCSISASSATEAKGGEVTKVKDFIIYNDEKFYSAFPSIVVREDGEILCAFRRAPNRRFLWGGRDSHTDTNSYLVLVRSTDGGETWTSEPELIYAHPLGGSQDPCMVQLNDGSIICTSYAWAMLPSGEAEKLENTIKHPPFAFLGGYIMRSEDGGSTWQGPFIPPMLPGNVSLDCLGQPLPTYNRGAMLQNSDGKLYWAVVRHDRVNPRLSSVHLVTSSDKGETWDYICPIASDETASFNETSLIELANGDIIAFLRTANFGGKAAFARSTDGGKSFQPWEDAEFIGHPFHAVRLPDDRVLLVYGYRQAPFGIRAKLLDAECSNIKSAPEIVIRDDGGNTDIGYPWAAILPDGEIMVAYYFNIENGVRHIAGSILSIE